MNNCYRSLFLLAIISVVLSTATANPTQDTALVVTAVEQEWVGMWNERWCRQKTHSGYDDQNRLMFTTYDYCDGLAQPYSVIWSYDHSSTTQLIVTWSTYDSFIENHEKYRTFHFPQRDSTVRYELKDNAWEYLWSTVKEYDPDGRLLEFRSDSTADKTYKKYLYEFTSSGLVASVTTQKYYHSASEWVTDTMRHFQYDSIGNIISEKEMSSSNLLQKETVYYYSDTVPDRLDKKVVYTYRGQGRWGRAECYEYDSRGNLSIETWKYGGTADSVWNNFSRIIYTYAYYPKQTGVKSVHAEKHSGVKVRETINELSLSGLLNGKAPVLCQVFDMKGRMLFSKRVSLSGGKIHIRKRDIAFSKQNMMLQIKAADGSVLWRGRIQSFK